jgi:hypothetical protein
MSYNSKVVIMQPVDTHLKNQLVATLNLLPGGVGSYLGVLVEKYLPSHIEKRRTEFLDSLAVSLEKLMGDITLEKLADDKFLCLFLRCAKMVIEEASEMKREALQAIILNAALCEESSFDEITLYLKHIETMTEDQVRILAELASGKLIPQVHSDLVKSLQILWPNIDHDYLTACVSDLYGANLISSAWRESGGGTTSLTGLGERFVAFISKGGSRLAPPDWLAPVISFSYVAFGNGSS